MLHNWERITSHTLEELEDNKLTEALAGDHRVGLLKKGDILYAFAATCPHASASLCDGWLNARGHIVCPQHQYHFDPANGRNTTGEGYKLRTYPVKFEGDSILVGFALLS
ncbi:MAG: Rieske (2Fe-2S) protein [Taibaiella sp.]|nr:Rieske (2Fe-2S) protein [Taibaiella sp.]